MSVVTKSYLLDTNIVIWLDRDLTRIPDAVLSVLADPSSELWVSAISFWELAIKQGLGNMDATIHLEPAIQRYRMWELPVTSAYADTVKRLPMLHRDPFDRMLVAQAMVEGMELVTGDSRLAGYSVSVLQV